MVLIKNANIYTMTDDGIIENGYMLMEGDTISSVGSMKNLPNVEAEVIDADGGCVTPGFIDAHSHLGMWEDTVGFAGADGNESTSPVTPQLRSIDAMNVCDVTFAEALSYGVTTVCSGPGSANVIGGMFTTVHTHGNVVDKMIVTPEAAMKFALGENPKNLHGQKGKEPLTRMAIASLIRESLYKAKECEENDFKYAPLKKVTDGILPAKFHAHKAEDICTAIRIAKEFNLKYSIEHATEALEIADYLKEENVQLITGPCLCNRSKAELTKLSIENCAKLLDKGFKIAMMSDHPATNIRLLPISAAYLMRYGISELDALATITSNAARSIHIDNMYGTIEAGKKADVLLFGKKPLDVVCDLKAVYIHGNKIQ